MSSPYIHQAGNTSTPAWLCLKSRGYEVTMRPSVGGGQEWLAARHDHELAADSIEALLGIAAIVEERHLTNWVADDRSIEAFLQEFYPDH